MCGIVGYIGRRDPVDLILTGLQRLEYRGYDSAGMALIKDGGTPELLRIRVAGKVSDLTGLVENYLKKENPKIFPAGIGHTRWATHGEPSERNAHPHFSSSRRFAVVHNGIVENYLNLKRKLEKDGYTFESETDTEVLPNLIDAFYKGNFKQAVAQALEYVEGTYGIAVISPLHPDRIVVARKGSPIVIGVSENETVIASDVSAILGHTQNVIYLEDEEIAEISADKVDISTLKNIPVQKEAVRIAWTPGQVEKGGYAHFMAKEIHEQPEAISNTLRGRLLHKEGTVKLSGLRMTPAEIASIKQIVIAACGTSLYAGMVGKYYFEELSDLPTDIEQAAEFRYRNPIVSPGTCLIAISQSGETADTLEAVREAERKGALTIGICNVVASSIARATGRGIYLHAGPEIGVASTKAFSSQVIALAMMAILFGRSKRLSASTGRELLNALENAPNLAKYALAQEQNIKKIAEKYFQVQNAFYIGRGLMYPVALEGALKLKEISYIHAEGYHAAELKHGPIALLASNVPVVALAPAIEGKNKMIANMQECKARSAPLIAIATEGDNDVKNYADDIIWVPECPEEVAPIPVVIAEQLLAYHIALLRGCPIDQPRNLAKSVTVE
jgi:glucosamine--fructose-6-phosphate aminotransferase (isomerizing)